jgi:hypothetical protein
MSAAAPAQPVATGFNSSASIARVRRRLWLCPAISGGAAAPSGQVSPRPTPEPGWLVRPRPVCDTRPGAEISGRPWAARSSHGLINASRCCLSFIHNVISTRRSAAPSGPVLYTDRFHILFASYSLCQRIIIVR